MVRQVFYSFHYLPDAWRSSQIRNIGTIEGNKPASDNDWETIKRGGNNAIKKWIDEQLHGRSCTIVLIGQDTANREWINYEITESWKAKKGLLGIYIHNLKDQKGSQSSKGKNPFNSFTLGTTNLSSIVTAYEPPYSESTAVYSYIATNISDWIEDAIQIRNNHS